MLEPTSNLEEVASILPPMRPSIHPTNISWMLTDEQGSISMKTKVKGAGRRLVES